MSSGSQILNGSSISIKADQTLIDIAIQEGGSVEALFDVAGRNGLSITDDLLAGGVYLKPALVVNESVVQKMSGIYPASGQKISETDLPINPEGIDYWVIENNFIVN